MSVIRNDNIQTLNNILLYMEVFSHSKGEREEYDLSKGNIFSASHYHANSKQLQCILEVSIYVS